MRLTWSSLSFWCLPAPRCPCLGQLLLSLVQRSSLQWWLQRAQHQLIAGCPGQRAEGAKALRAQGTEMGKPSRDTGSGEWAGTAALTLPRAEPTLQLSFPGRELETFPSLPAHAEGA